MLKKFSLPILLGLAIALLSPAMATAKSHKPKKDYQQQIRFEFKTNRHRYYDLGYDAWGNRVAYGVGFYDPWGKWIP